LETKIKRSSSQRILKLSHTLQVPVAMEELNLAKNNQTPIINKKLEVATYPIILA